MSYLCNFVVRVFFGERTTHDNCAPGNAGVEFFTDIGVPLIGLVLPWLLHRTGRGGARLPQARPA